MDYSIEKIHNDWTQASFKIGSVLFRIVYKDYEPLYMEMNDLYAEEESMDMMIAFASFRDEGGTDVKLSDCVAEIEELMAPKLGKDYELELKGDAEREER